MTPYDSAYTQDPRISRIGMSCELIEGYHYGRSVPELTRYLWFNPDESTSIQEAIQTENGWLIESQCVQIKIESIVGTEWCKITRKDMGSEPVK